MQIEVFNKTHAPNRPATSKGR